MAQWRQTGMILLGAILLVACGGGDTDNPPPGTIPTATSVPAIVAIATWTPVPSPTLLPTLTLAPTSTSAVSGATFAPPAETGLGEVGDQVIVTVLEADLNATIAQTYNAASLDEASAPPVVTFESGYQLKIEVSFTNEFLDEESRVTLRAIIEIVDGQIRLKEIQEGRDWDGPTPSDQAIWQVFEVMERGINSAIFDLLRAQPGASTLRLINVRQFPDSPQVRARLEAVFAG